MCPDHDYCNGIFASLSNADDIIEYILIYRGEALRRRWNPPPRILGGTKLNPDRRTVARK